MLLIGGFYMYNQSRMVNELKDTKPTTITSFTECVAAGNPVMESYPRQCAANGVTYTEDIGNELEKTNLIRSTYPRPNDLITSPIAIEGEARGYWFFEASFPVTIEDANGVVLARTYIEAQDEWMTESFVPYARTIEFDEPTAPTGRVILHRDNPSGLPENDDELIIPVRFE